MKHIVVLGAGFAGLWSAASAARVRDEHGLGADDICITVMNATAWHSIRVRNYEADLSDTRVPLVDVLEPIGVQLIVAEVTDICLADQTVFYAAEGRIASLHYDRLIFALGSRLARPPVAGLDTYAFDVDTYEAAARLDLHLWRLADEAPSSCRDTVLVVGAGLTGIEVAAELPARLRSSLAGDERARPRIILADRSAAIGSDMGDSAKPVIAEALAALGVEMRPETSVVAIDADGARLVTGERIWSRTIIWCAGMEASPLTACFPIARDPSGRLPVTSELRICGLQSEFAAGDSAWFAIDGCHSSVMSCQHSRPMGRFAGHNAICDLLGVPLLPLRIDWYSTILDLGDWGAVCTEGWDRRVVKRKEEAKIVKQTINRQRIYPPRTRDRQAIFAAAEPIVQMPPAAPAAPRA